MDFTVSGIRAHLAAGGGAVAIAEEALERIARFGDPALFLHAVPRDALLRDAASLPPGPLHGVPFVVKDNIAVAGMPTTAACRAFSHVPAEDAPAVARLKAAGALLLGKVNLDQFATGLNGTRSPYGTPRNARDARLVPGGSSSGSATAVAAGIAAFSLGTDTAGSGRVPAMAQGIVGLKPTVGLVPSRGVVPACRSIDCVSVFAQSVADAATVLGVIAGADAQDPYSRPSPPFFRAIDAAPPRPRLLAPLPDELVFDGPVEAALYDAALARLTAAGASLTRVSIAPFLALARRLYDGAWVAERTSALRDWVENRPDALHPVTRAILEGGLNRRTVDAFDDFHAQAEARLLARAMFAAADALVLPTAPGIPTLEVMAADPIGANSRLGTYTNFVNLCDLAALAVPVPGDVPFGLTFVAPAFRDGALAGIGAAFVGEPLEAPTVAADEVELFCIGAHMSGLPLNPQVLRHGGRFLREATSAPLYRLKSLGNRPGMFRGAPGVSVAGEVWALPLAGIGPFLVEIPPPLGFGRVELADGTKPLGFIAEEGAVRDAPDISHHGGWRAFLASQAR
ncbi:MAG: allophanate hydrolase [Acetobacteraceae bacterium]|nr:allophanate hydrolase [Acetobacteraceae bacterium]